MKKIMLGFVFAILSLPIFAFVGKSVGPTTAISVYQLDSDATVFEFLTSEAHVCGSNIYRVKSPNEAVAQRKFSMILTAFVSGKKIAFHDTEVCEGDRSVVGWVKLVN